MTAAWSTPEELDAAYRTIAATIDRWSDPAVWAVGMTSATSSAEYEFPVINVGQEHLAAAVLGKTVGYSHGTETVHLSVAELSHAANGLAPAGACAEVPQPNLEAWLAMLDEVDSNPYRSLVAVFIGDLDDPVTSDADGSLRTQLPG